MSSKDLSTNSVVIRFHPRRPMQVRVHSVRRPNTALLDAQIGVSWWNRLPLAERNAWLEQPRTAHPVDCWNAYKRGAVLTDQVQP